MGNYSGFLTYSAGLATNTSIYILMDLLCAGILAGFEITTLGRGIRRRENRLLYFVLLSQSAIFMLDAIWAFFDGTTGTNIYFNYLINGCYFGMSGISAYVWLYFVDYRIDAGLFKNNATKILFSIPIFVVAILGFTAPWNNLLFTITADNHYQRGGTLYFLQPVITYSYIIIAMLLTFFNAAKKRRGHMSTVERSFLGFSAIPIAGGIYQVIDGTLPVFNGCMTMALTYIYIVLQREQMNYQTSIIDNVSDEYKMIGILDLNNGKLTIYRGLALFKALIGSEGKNFETLDDIVRRVVDRYVLEDDKDSVIEKMSLGYISFMLDARSSFNFGFRALLDGEYCYYQMKLVRPEDDSMTSNMVLIGLSNVDRDTKKEKAIQEELEDAKLAAEYANKTKSTFLFNMSHDIRTPMNAILGFTEMAKKYKGDQEKVDECHDKVTSAGNHLLSLINDILDMARMENGKIKIETRPVSITESVDNLVTMIGSLAVDKNIDFKVKCNNLDHDFVYADALHVNQIILNIISNAIKYTNEGGSVHYIATELPSAIPGKATYEFKVSDTGIGMSEEFVKNIFETYSREQTAETEKIQGTGLGMAITKQLVDLMDGDIKVESKLGFGTTMTVNLTFDIYEGEIEKPKEADASEIDLKGKRILLVEDNELNREIAVDILLETGVEIETAVDGVDAVEKASFADAGYYDIILMDINMPRMNGYDATGEIRKLPKYEHTPIIAMTANAFEEDKRRALAAGMDAHIAKPIEIGKFYTTLAEFNK